MAPDPEIRSDPDIQACSKVVKLYPVNNRGSPFRIAIRQPRAGYLPVFLPDEKNGMISTFRVAKAWALKAIFANLLRIGD